MEMRQKLAQRVPSPGSFRCLAPAASSTNAKAPAASTTTKHRADVERMAPGSTDKHSMHRANGVLPTPASLPAPPYTAPRTAKSNTPVRKPKGPTERALMRHAQMLDDAATKLQTALRRITAKAEVGDMKAARDQRIAEEKQKARDAAHAAEQSAQATKRNLVVFVFVPLLFGAGIIAATFVDEELARAVLRRQGPPSNWRQAIDCCTDQRVTIPVPHAAKPKDLVGVQWFEQGRRSVSYELLSDSRSFSKRTVSFELPWTLVGHNHLDGAAPCMPKARALQIRPQDPAAPSRVSLSRRLILHSPSILGEARHLQPDRYCQYGYTPYVEMAAISVACEGSLDGQVDAL